MRRAAEHTRNRPTDRHLGLERYGVQIVWVGMSKMRWSHLMSLIQGLLNLYGFPSALLIHHEVTILGILKLLVAYSLIK